MTIEYVTVTLSSQRICRLDEISDEFKNNLISNKISCEIYKEYLLGGNGYYYTIRSFSLLCNDQESAKYVKEWKIKN